ncbi:hypothetical protein RchiOBHm_Chr5g0081001 [Rosa chinensis]|uniref:Uncharacterized protein n=1 Tax=Rosa chinensis TaxID=74649 RepID=A0A2P6QMY0_ROSCH|nr:hypothetical protein RchiOBHm_Chr5g0081001 [Rosa chinensis]
MSSSFQMLVVGWCSLPRFGRGLELSIFNRLVFCYLITVWLFTGFYCCIQ